MGGAFVYILDAHSIKTEMEGFEYIMVSFPSRREQATPHWGVAFRMFKSLIEAKNTHTPYGVWVFLLLVYTFDIDFRTQKLSCIKLS